MLRCLRALPIAAASLGATLGILACPPKPPQMSRPDRNAPAPNQIPARCDADLSGTYAHGVDPSFRYQASDDGGTLLLTVERIASDGGLTNTSSGTGARIQLLRTPHGFVGQTQAMVTLRSGQRCPIEFPTEMIACDDAGILLRSATAALPPDDLCRSARAGISAATLEHRLNRLPQPVSRHSADAGEPSQTQTLN